MPESRPLLSIVTSAEGNVVNIHADQAGLQILLKDITRLIKKLEADQCDHDHLFSESWGGWELTESMLSQEHNNGCRKVHHLKINAWTAEWRTKLNL